MRYITYREAIESVEQTKQLLAEVISADQMQKLNVRVPNDFARSLGVTCQYTDSAIDRSLIWKAGCLRTLHNGGPEHGRMCLHCYTLEPWFPWNNCPTYPVGAMLAGVITGCQP